jgi:hypothetical protein
VQVVVEEEFYVEHFLKPHALQLLRRGQGTHDPPPAQHHKHKRDHLQQSEQTGLCVYSNERVDD